MVDAKEEAYRKRMKEIKEAKPSTYRQNAETGEWEPDPTAKSFGPIYSQDVDRWVKEGKVPKEMAQAFHDRNKRAYKHHEIWKKFKDQGKTSQEALEEYVAYLNENEPVNYEELRKEANQQKDFIDFLIENKDTIVEIFNEEERRTVRYSEDYIRETLDVTPESRQLDLFENPKIQEKVTNQEIVIAGLDFTPSQDCVIHTLITLLSKKSEVWDQSSPDFYMGNNGKRLLNLEGGNEAERASITCEPIEYYKAYTHRDNISGKDIKEILESTREIAAKNYMVSLTIEKEVDGEKRYDRILTYLPLFKFIHKKNNFKSKKELESFSSSNDEMFEFQFHPIFTSNIRNRYVELPDDIHARMRKACGSPRGIAKSTNHLKLMLFREKKHRRYKIVRDLDTLIEKLKLQKDRKKQGIKFVKTRIEKDLDIFRKLGLVIDWKEKTGKGGQVQYEILINKDFQ